MVDIEEPKSFKTASNMPQWQAAMQDELDALKMQRTWCLVPLPSNRTMISSKWVYKIKKNQDGSISRYKARLMAQVIVNNLVWIFLRLLFQLLGTLQIE